MSLNLDAEHITVILRVESVTEFEAAFGIVEW